MNTKDAASSKVSALVSWKKRSKISGYQIRFSLKKNMKGAKTVTVSKAKKTKVTIKGLKKGKTYYFSIRTYKKKGKKYYSAWSTPKKLKVK